MNNEQEELKKIWQAVLGGLEVDISPANFHTWFKGTFIYKIKDGQAVIAVPSVFARDWIRDKHQKDVFYALKRLNNSIQSLDFKITTQPARNANIVMVVGRGDGGSGSIRGSRPNLNPRYTFDSFIVGNNNRLAHAVSVAVSQNPGKLHNPLFVYGGVGLGKTHLIQSIGNAILQKYPKKKIIYLSCEDFTNEFVQAIQGKRIEGFKNKYRDTDVFLVDDIQFITGKGGTQEEFFHTFNALHQKNKQIVLTADRLPKAIPDLQERLSSRLGWGMVADIKPPNLETRHAILQSRCREMNWALPDEVLYFISQSIYSNIRELEAALTKLIAYCQLHNQVPDNKLAAEVLEDLIQAKAADRTPEKTMAMVAEYFQLKKDDLAKKSRGRDLMLPRQIAIYLIKSDFNISWAQLGRMFGGRDHTTIMHSREKIEKELVRNPEIKRLVTEIREKMETE